MNTLPGSIIIALACAATLHAGTRSSAAYTIPADTLDAGGRPSASAEYTQDASIGGISGAATSAVPARTLIAGYIAQLTPPAGLVITAAVPTVAENGTRQLSAAVIGDDGSIAAVPANLVNWSVFSGPLTGISGTGLVTAGTVPQNSAATVRGTYSGQTAFLSLTVTDVLTDNFGIYAGDGLPDWWQAHYFGLDNPAAAPAADPDGDAQDNLFEYAAGLKPNDRQSHFELNLVPHLPGQMAIVFSPVLLPRNYTVEYSSLLTGGLWQALSGAPQYDNGSERTVTDVNATGPRKFYRVNIVNPGP